RAGQVPARIRLLHVGQHPGPAVLLVPGPAPDVGSPVPGGAVPDLLGAGPAGRTKTDPPAPDRGGLRGRPRPAHRALRELVLHLLRGTEATPAWPAGPPGPPGPRS